MPQSNSAAAAAVALLLLFLLLPSSAAASNSSASLNYTLTIVESDYEVGSSLEEVLSSPNLTFVLKFGNLPGQSNPHSLGIVYAASPSTLLWYTFRDDLPGQYDNLGGTSTTLRLSSDGDLSVSVQANGVDVLVWSSATAGMGVAAMELRDDGNLALVNSSGGVVWQSFDHPTDTLVPSQRLTVGSHLLAPARNGYPNAGFTMLAMEQRRLVAYVSYVEPEPYWALEAAADNELAYAAIENGRIAVFDGSGAVVAAAGNESSGGGALQRLSLDPDGNIRLYSLGNGSTSWTTELQVITTACALPDDCGFSGLCIPGQGCACPPTFALLATLNGCVAPRGLVCGSKHGSEFVQISAASYFAADHNLSSATTSFGLSRDSCRSLCTANCSCLAFFHRSSDGACLLTAQLRTFSASVYGNYTDKYSFDLFVRVQGKGENNLLRILLGVLVPIGVIAFVVVLWWFVRYRVKAAHAEEEEFLLAALPGLPPRYSLAELKAATEGFSRRIGGGSFGSVYDGALPDGSRVAVKRLEGEVQGKKEFHAEIATIGTVRHVNLVCLKGFCLDKGQRLLVYEHMARGSLDGLLFIQNRRSDAAGKNPALAEDGGNHHRRTAPLPLSERFSIAVGVAKALAYLHEGCPECIIHCDIKPENVLVTDGGDAKLSDFGLSKMMSRKKAAAAAATNETIVRGTRGYMAPEWLRGGVQITEKADVFSYGVLLLEIMAGRRNYEGPGELSSRYMPEWALRNLSPAAVPMASEAVQELLDPAIAEELGRSGEWKEAKGRIEEALMVAVWCVQEEAGKRPAMSRVVKMLEGDVKIPAPPPPPPVGQSIFSGTAAAAASSSATFETERSELSTQSEVAMPFLRRFLFSSSSSSSSAAAPPPRSSFY